MKKRTFWPLALVTMGLIFLAANMGYLPFEFNNLWPLIAIIVGLGGWLLSDSEEWLVSFKSDARSSQPVAKKKTSAKKVAKKRK